MDLPTNLPGPSLSPLPNPQINNLLSLLVSSRFLTKLTKDPRKIMALDLSEGRVKSRLGNSIKIKDHLIAQFRRLYRDVDSASLRNSLPKILSEMEVLTLKVPHNKFFALVLYLFVCSLCCLPLWNSTTEYLPSIKTRRACKS
jgi:hypothetical protein